MARAIVFALLAIFLFTVTAQTGFAGKNEKDISLEKVPPAARKTAEQAVPTARWNEAEKKKTKQGQVVYEICGKDRDREVEVETDANGKLVEVEVEIPKDQVPDTVRQALQSHYPNFKTDEVNTVTRQGQSDGYEFEGEDRNGKEMEVFVSADGKTVTVEEFES